MRYDKPVYFIRKNNKNYDPDSGEWTKGETIRTKRYANVTHMGADRQQVVFGDVKSNRLIVRLQRAYTDNYDYIEYAGKLYTVDSERCPSDRQSLVVIQNVWN